MSLAIVRIWLPATIAIVGVALIAFGSDAAMGAGIVLVGVAGLVLLANLLIRLALMSERDRQHEDERRRFFARRGRWPDGRPR
jgi:hypothetical protein